MKIKVENLSLEEKIGQMLIVGVESNRITERTKKLILKYKIGGVILYRRNFNTYEEMINLIKDLKELNKQNKVPLFISIDQEGGRVNRMPKEILNLPSANLIANKLGEKGIKEAAKITGEILSKSGFNMNFAPVLDLKRFDNKSIGDRSFGENIECVTKYGIAQMKSFQDKKIISVIKHFPGNGATKEDSHYRLPIIKLKIKTLEIEDMKPFEEAIKNGADGILVGHLKIREMLDKEPCSLSRKFIIKYLRKKYHYKGLIISDDLKMRAIKYRYGTTKALTKSFKAGNDITIFRFNEKQEEKAILNIIELAKAKKLNMYRINSSVKRILKIKNKYELDEEKEFEKLDLENINEKILEIRKMVLDN